MSNKPVLNVDDAEFQELRSPNGKFHLQFGSMSGVMGATKLGYNVTVLPPGKAAWPYHFHHANEELFVVLDGTGVVRYGDEEHPLRAGDVIFCPPGSNAAHQIRNDSDADLKYIAISTKESPELAEYPDSGKYGVLANPDPDGGDDAPPIRILGRLGETLDYWEGED